MKAYFSCGAGDFIAIESFMTDREKNNISEFVLFTRAAQYIKELILIHPIWKDKKITVPLTPEEIRDFKIYSFYDIKHLEKITGRIWPETEGALDFSGERIYPEILNDERHYTISLFDPPKMPEFTSIIDASSNADDRLTKKGRNLTPDEINVIKSQHNSEANIKFVGPEYTTISEALGLIRNTHFFWGVDSMCSVWAARQRLAHSRIKTVNPIYRKWRKIYDPFRKLEVVDAIR